MALLLTLTILKGIRMPGRWGVTHSLLRYRFGFVKRGLWGEVLWLALGRATSHYFVLAAVAIAVLGLLVALLVRRLRQLPESLERVPLFFVVCASPALSFFVHLAGYPNLLAIVATLAILGIRSWPLRVAAAIAGAAVLPLVHEASVLWVGSLLALAVFVPLEDRRWSPLAAVAAVVALACVWGCSEGFVAMRGTPPPEYVELLRRDRTRFADFRPRQDVFGALSQPIDEAAADMQRRWKEPTTQAEMLYSLGVFLPGLVLSAVLVGRLARRVDAVPSVRHVAVALAAAGVASPLLLHIVGWDIHRWNAWATLNAGIAALALAGARARNPGTTLHGRTRGRLVRAALMVCLWGVGADLLLFDGKGPKHPPFFDQGKFLYDAIRSGDSRRWVPDAR